MASQPPDGRGWWRLLSAVNPLLLALGLRGQLGPEAQAESEAARRDWFELVRSPLADALVLALTIVVAIAVVVVAVR